MGGTFISRHKTNCWITVLAAGLLLGAGTSLAAQDFIRGDVNGDGSISVADGLVLAKALKGAGPQPSCRDAADVDDSGGVSDADLSSLLDALVGGGIRSWQELPAYCKT